MVGKLSTPASCSMCFFACLSKMHSFNNFACLGLCLWPSTISERVIGLLGSCNTLANLCLIRFWWLLDPPVLARTARCFHWGDPLLLRVRQKGWPALGFHLRSPRRCALCCCRLTRPIYWIGLPSAASISDNICPQYVSILYNRSMFPPYKTSHFLQCGHLVRDAHPYISLLAVSEPS